MCVCVCVCVCVCSNSVFIDVRSVGVARVAPGAARAHSARCGVRPIWPGLRFSALCSRPPPAPFSSSAWRPAGSTLFCERSPARTCAPVCDSAACAAAASVGPSRPPAHPPAPCVSNLTHSPPSLLAAQSATRRKLVTNWTRSSSRSSRSAPSPLRHGAGSSPASRTWSMLGAVMRSSWPVPNWARSATVEAPALTPGARATKRAGAAMVAGAKAGRRVDARGAGNKEWCLTQHGCTQTRRSRSCAARHERSGVRRLHETATRTSPPCSLGTVSPLTRRGLLSFFLVFAFTTPS